MPVSPIEEKAEKGLSRSGETEEAEEDGSLLGRSPVAMRKRRKVRRKKVAKEESQ